MGRNTKNLGNAVTVRDVAQRAAVSVGTVSRVLNNHANVETELKRRVLGAASELGYMPRTKPANGTPTQTTPKSSTSLTHIAFCGRAGTGTSSGPGPLHNPYFSMILSGVETECRRQNIHLLYHVFEDSPAALLDTRNRLLESGADGLLLMNFTNRTLLNGLLKMELPAVLVDHYYPDLPLDVVMSENYWGAFQAVQYLLEKGHRRIGFIDGLPHATIQRRREGYRAALEAAGLVYDPSLIVQGNLSAESGNQAAEDILAQRLDCTAYFCANDTSAIGFIQRLTEKGVRVPDDISVVGYDDIELSRLISPPLTSVRASADIIGRVAVQRLIERAKDPTFPVTQTLINATLVKRRSVKNLSSDSEPSV